MKKASIKSGKIKTICIFVLVSVLLQGGASLFLTPGGLSLLYPFVVRAYCEELSPGDNSYVEYYDMRQYVNTRDTYIVSMDYGVAESYTFALDFIRYLKINLNVTQIGIECGPAEAVIINRILTEEDSAAAEQMLSAENGWLKGYSKTFLNFIRSLRLYNMTYPPYKKMTVYALGFDRSQDTVKRYVSEIMARHMSNTTLIMRLQPALSSENIAIFAKEITADPDYFRVAFGDDFEELYTICTGFLSGEPVDAATLYARICKPAAEGGVRSAIAFIDGFACMTDGTSRDAALRDIMYAGVENPDGIGQNMFLKLQYSTSESLDQNGNVTERNSIALPAFLKEAAYYFVDSDRFSWFESWYRFASVLPGGGEDAEIYDRFGKYFILIRNGKAVEMPDENEN